MIPRRKRPIAERFWEKVNKSGTCWEWTGTKISRGYGNFRINGKTEYAHRVSYILTHGEVPDGKFVCHRCDNPGCVNPDHLFAGTPQENAVDCVNKGRARRTPMRGESSSRCQFTDSDVRRAIEMRRRGVPSRKIAEAIGCSQHSVIDWTTHNRRALA